MSQLNDDDDAFEDPKPKKTSLSLSRKLRVTATVSPSCPGAVSSASVSYSSVVHALALTDFRPSPSPLSLPSVLVPVSPSSPPLPLVLVLPSVTASPPITQVHLEPVLPFPSFPQPGLDDENVDVDGAHVPPPEIHPTNTGKRVRTPFGPVDRNALLQNRSFRNMLFAIPLLEAPPSERREKKKKNQ
eukprot:TRINITY_DN21668_c0_g1_i1.p1 TRINITY_DN21668_c0_g1~~TRINITY_DN21668_c0_g1_i1.p1  ORF type:complete len:187 (-),score=41.60 TRINITY_DN21668_c0_g1_i1:35-595(-)